MRSLNKNVTGIEKCTIFKSCDMKLHFGGGFFFRQQDGYGSGVGMVLYQSEDLDLSPLHVKVSLDKI